MMTPTTDRTDAELLECFTGQKEEEAFAELVRRHGPLVLGVCRKLLRHEQDAEDAFQATFLVLARRAGSLYSAAVLPSWLYGVATRLAARIRTASSRRRAREVPLVDPATPEPPPDSETDDVAPVLHEEIGRLPEKYRVPLILCYLEGKTNEEAAQLLHCPPGTIFSRLARARERLRNRLKRRGLVLSTGVLATALATLPRDARAAVPPQLALVTAHLAVRFATRKMGRGPDVPAHLAALVSQGSQSPFQRAFAVAAALLVLLGLVGLLAFLLRGRREVEQPNPVSLQGTWTLTELVMNGQALPGNVQGQVTLDANEMVFTTPFMRMAGPYRIDTEKNPMQIDWTPAEGGIAHGIVERRGDTLTICINPSGDPRPTDFTPGPNKFLLVCEHSGP
jgi:RNA polymerase sigma factor (sigma-70 family)